MKPKNEKEINNAFFQFLLLFLLTVVIVVVAVFFDYGFPWKDYSNVKSQFREVSSVLNNKNALITKLDSINAGLSRYDSPGSVPSIIESDISSKLTELKQTTSSDSASIKLNNSLFRAYSMLLKSKIDFRKLNEENGKLQYDLTTLQTSYDKLKEQYDDLDKQYESIINSRRQ